MGLSDDEQQQLARIERGLVREDPRLAATLSGNSAQRILRSGTCWLIGLALLIAGLITVTGDQVLLGGTLCAAGLIMMGRTAISLMSG